jgi:hypothetical protein
MKTPSSLIALFLTTFAALTAPAATPRERSADVMTQQQFRHPGQEFAPASGPTVDDVGDPYSFGKPVKFLGFTQILGAGFSADCTGSEPNTCVTSPPQPEQASFNFPDQVAVKLPGDRNRTLLCFSVTNLSDVTFRNDLSTPQRAMISATATVTIESDFLNDPTLIDPATGLPYAGQMRTGSSLIFDEHTIHPGDRDLKFMPSTRSCIAGNINKRQLLANGWTDGQISQFFRKPMTIRFGASGSARMIESANIFYGVRIYGD